jgi:hypothetical protein
VESSVLRARSLAFVVAATIVLGTASGQAQAIIPPTGDRRAVNFFENEAATYADVAGVKLVETGYFFVRPAAQKSVSYWWGSLPPAGYTPATATVRAQLSDGKIVAYAADLKAPGVRRLRIVMAGSVVFTSTTACWNRSKPSASPLGTGERYLFNEGGANFVSRTGDTVTFTYFWAPGATATETDVFTARHPSPVDISIKVGGRRPLSIRKSITPLAQAPQLPVPPPPARPAPKPICS